MRQTLRTTSSFLRVLAGLLFALMLSQDLRAQVSPTYAYSSGTSSNSFPLNSTSSNMCQWLLTPADFTPTAPTSGILLTTVYIRASNTVAAGSTFTNLTIKLNTSSTLTALTSGAWNTGLTTVFSQASTAISGWTAGDWIPFSLPTPVFYNGTSNILIEVSQTGYTGTGMMVRQGTGTGNRRMFGSAASTSSSGADASRLNFGFDAAPAACSGQPSAPSIASAAINPATPVCAGSTATITASNPNLGSGITMQWQTATASTGPWTTVVGGTGATSITYTTPPLTGNRFYRLAVTCTNSNLTAFSPAYLVPVGAPQPGTISGPSNFCPGDPITFSVPNVTGSTYSWTLPSGWSGSSATNTITVTPGSTAGSIAVTASSPCGTSVPRSSALIRGSAPAAAFPVSGSRFICSNTTQVYSVSPVTGATSYSWTLPSGWTGSSTTPSITASNTRSGGNVIISAVNGCGSSATTTVPVTIISSLAHPGPITGRDTACSGALQSYRIAPVNGATSYVWTLPSGWSGTTTGTSIQAFAGNSNDTIRVTAHVSCASSPVAVKRITVLQTVTPDVTLVAPTTQLCSGVPALFTAAPTHPGSAPVYTWQVNGTPVSSGGPSYTTNTLRNGDQVSVSLRSNAACATITTAQSAVFTANVINSVAPGISISAASPTSVCRGTQVRFSATSAEGGTAPRYQWHINGAAVPGATGTTFSGNNFRDRDTIMVTMASNAVCATAGSAQSNRIGLQVADSLLPTVTIDVSPSSAVLPGVELEFTATETGGGATPDYQWMRNGVSIPFATGKTFRSASLRPGDHISVRMHSYLSCATQPTVHSNVIDLIDGTLGVSSGTARRFGLFPNPSGGIFTISGPVVAAGSSVQVEVLDEIGRRVYSEAFRAAGGALHQQVNLPASLPSGNYLLRLSLQQATDAAGVTETTTLRVQR